MPSKAILGLAIAFCLVWSFLDVKYHGHYSDARYKQRVEKVVDENNFFDDRSDVQVGVSKRWVTVDGIVKSDEDRKTFSRVVSNIPGIRGISDNLVGNVNVEALEKLRLHLGENPNVHSFDYLVGSRKKVILTGRVETEPVKETIGALVAKLGGIRSVENNLLVGPPPPVVTEVEPSLKQKIEEIIINILRIQNIYFDFNKATIREESLPSIDKIANVLKEYPEIKIRIEGHTDAIGSDAYNQVLSDKRANSVRNALIERGIPGERLAAVGFGESRPIADNGTPERRAENRRIEFKVN